MAESSLQDRLRDHAKAFDGLLSLIPAKMYYGEDTSNQWNKKKQTKQEAAAARRGKLDPDSELNRNAKEVMDERAKNKRKLREMQQEDDGDDEDEWEDFDPVPGVDSEKPGEGLKTKTEGNKKQKLDDDDDSEPTDADNEEPAPTPKSQKQAKKQAKTAAAKAQKQKEVDETSAVQGDGEVEPMDISGLEKDDEATDNSMPESEPHSPTFDSSSTAPGAPAEPVSATTSVSSTIPPSEKPKHIKIPADTEALRARLAAKIEALRAARKADGPDGKPIRTRQELIESRRRKQELRKAHKQELRKQARLEEQRKREEALASSSPGVRSPAVELDENSSNFTFGRVAFGDGAKLSHDLSYVLNQGKKKGPSDAKTALIKVQNQKKRLQELDPEKRADIEEKDAWLTARRRAEGEKIRDDEALLKRAVKRKEAAKKKSEKAWRERSDGVKLAQKERQRKREDNLRKRRDDKLLGKAGKKKKKPAVGTKKKGRPGFEGSLGVGGRKK
ncbi:hypothetical protein CEP52_002205 [Fusarium oligoseptatum]|uniref:Ribosomal RNA-processing protein 14/surfeit locus protein 6 C-terminal domain-containing protein n=1 Tax=Fusarium oligoseptatum TaxID=2604345 RepID=A0A428UF46_9HYPO|nr:hypothetical protein CEP52_002205 [Fusarium oligoseptatum]